MMITPAAVYEAVAGTYARAITSADQYEQAALKAGSVAGRELTLKRN
jgi:hypothetical protein